MGVFYAAAYWIGFRPWETAAIREADRISELFDREESGRQPPYGRALDLGCGTGMQSVALARRGWQVTGRAPAESSARRAPAGTTGRSRRATRPRRCRGTSGRRRRLGL
jgi:SAM-dependent methyltransferase